VKNNLKVFVFAILLVMLISSACGSSTPTQTIVPTVVPVELIIVPTVVPVELIIIVVTATEVIAPTLTPTVENTQEPMSMIDIVLESQGLVRRPNTDAQCNCIAWMKPDESLIVFFMDDGTVLISSIIPKEGYGNLPIISIIVLTLYPGDLLGGKIVDTFHLGKTGRTILYGDNYNASIKYPSDDIVAFIIDKK